MKEDASDPNERDEKKVENEFLKMKLMLEHGAQFGFSEEESLPVEVENQFLQNIITFEKLYEQRKQITVFEKIEKPDHFKPADEIPPEKMEEAWNELEALLRQYSIELHVCSPNVSIRELYRFTLEELFKLEMEDIPMPGWITSFIYDEFYPDPVYECQRTVEVNMFPEFFSVNRVGEYFSLLFSEKLRVNGRSYEKREEFIDSLNFLKSFYSIIELKSLHMASTNVIDEKNVTITGGYKASGNTMDGRLPVEFAGNFLVQLSTDSLGYWCINNLEIEGIDLPSSVANDPEGKPPIIQLP